MNPGLGSWPVGWEYGLAYEYRIKKAIIKANSPVASDRANPRIAYWNNCSDIPTFQ